MRLILMLVLLAGCDKMIIDTEDYSIIKEFEGFRNTVYQCSANRDTIGYGSTAYPLGTVKKGDRIISKTEAHTLLHEHVRTVVLPHISDLKLNKNQREALISFIYNVGSTNFNRSTMLKKLKAENYVGASKEFIRWNKAGKRVLKGLTKRRIKERDLFLKPVKKKKKSLISLIIKQIFKG